MNDLKVGDRVRDNDPRMGSNRVLTVTRIEPAMWVGEEQWVYMTDSMGNERRYRGRSIRTDNKPRRSGFNRIEEPAHD